jgi:hypothetical protein
MAMAITHEDLTFALRDFALSLASAMGKARGAVRTADTEMMKEAFGEAEAAAQGFADWLEGTQTGEKAAVAGAEPAQIEELQKPEGLEDAKAPAAKKL